ncbi:hypothetical protein BDR07DRAFT_1448480 [Suillus spraguei]|nr:hypothetical protein BDR07DRAFT_1448480 [Suillus spraguei]
MIACCRAKCWIVQLKEENQDLQLSTNQCGIKGHIIVYPQCLQGIANVLPPLVADIITPLCIIFVGLCPLSRAWLEEKAKPLIARREKVQAALVWLKKHNRLYKDITIDFDVLNSMDEKMLMPFHVNHILPNDARDSLTSKYDANDSVQLEDLSDVHDYETSLSNHDDSLHAAELQINFENVVVTDVDGNASANELHAAAVCHIKNKGSGYVQIPHDTVPVNEFFDLDLFLMIYPTFFPFGLGGFEDHLRTEPLSIKRHWHKILLHTSLKVKRDSFPTVATNLAAVYPGLFTV